MATDIGQLEIQGAKVSVLRDGPTVVLKVKKGWINKQFALSVEQAESLVALVTEAINKIKE